MPGDRDPGHVVSRPDFQGNLVHELTHALLDQFGQLGRPEDSDAQVGLDALIEGQAEYMESYRA